MSENDLSDEAGRQYWQTLFVYGENQAGGMMWREAIRRAKANPWQLFGDDEIVYYALKKDIAPAQAELERRKAK